MTASSIMSGPTSSAPSEMSRFGVVAIVAAQEFQWVFGATNRSTKPGVANFDFVKQERRVGVYYFYVLDPEFGPGFIKICTYFPYPAKVWVNGHEWAKRQADRDGVGVPRVGQRVRRLRRPRTRCRRSVTGSGPPTCRASSTVGSRSSRPRSPPRIAPRATGGNCRCAKSRCRAPWSSTILAAPAGSSRRSSTTTSASAVPKRSPSCSPARSARPPRASSAPGSSDRAPR